VLTGRAGLIPYATALNRIRATCPLVPAGKNQVLPDRRLTPREIAQVEIDFGIGQQRADLVNVIAALNSNRLTKQMDNRIALVTVDFLIRLLKRLRNDMFDMWLHESLKLMKCVTERPGHATDCSPWDTEVVVRLISELSKLADAWAFECRVH
jgi:hypothetical protein